jgi:hypothetical protein
MTRQEVELFFNPLESVDRLSDVTLSAIYADITAQDIAASWKQPVPSGPKPSSPKQRQLF